MSIPENMKQIADLSNKLLNEELSYINSILHQDVSKGWQCPICSRVYSPTTPMCFYCGNKK